MQINGAVQTTASSMAIFAHELREPLASILLAVQAAGETANNDQTNREMWGVVERQSSYLACIIERVMEFGRGSHGKIVLSKGWCDLGTMIMNAVEAVKPVVLSREHRLTVSLPPTPIFMLADALRLQQVVINLLANAAKYTERAGRISVSLEVVNDLVMIEVRDNGVGISPDLLPRVFDLFRQGEKRCGSKSAGMGIGLALVKSLVELHGGSISAHSGGTGAGSTFVVILPHARPEVGKQQADALEPNEMLAVEPAWAGSAMLDA